jgi:uncharacterized protein (TIGR02757 family)
MDRSLIDLLEVKTQRYNRISFIEDDPVSVPHSFSKKENIEIAGFLTATIAWGQRKTIIRNAMDLVQRMDGDPHDFLQHLREEDIGVFRGFKHRTFTDEDCIYFIRALHNIYRNHGGLSEVFRTAYRESGSVKSALISFRDVFFQWDHAGRTRKHVADPGANAAAKRLNMFLRWMVRRDEAGVDFGIWDFIPMSGLFLPLDVHTGTVARDLGILKRKQNDWKAVEEVTAVLGQLDPEDPVKYDFALFGMGLHED